MSENTCLTYYQRNKDVILNKTKDYYKKNKERLREQVRDKYRKLSEEEKIKTENMGRTDTTICPKKRNKDQKNIKRIITRKKGLNIIMNKTIFNCNCNCFF